MALRRALSLLSEASKGGGGGERGLYFPIKHRVIDMRVHPVVAEQADVQSRYRRELRSSTITGEARQVEPPAWSARQRPTHFLSLKLPARCGLRSLTKEMWNTVLFAHPHVEPLVIPQAKLHVTLGVLSIPPHQQQQEQHQQGEPGAAVSRGLEDNPRTLATSSNSINNSSGDEGPVLETSQEYPDQEELIQRIREEVTAVVANEWLRRGTHAERTADRFRDGGLQLHFAGLGTFARGRVLFARCAADRDFHALDRLVRALRYRLGVGLGLDVKGNPHDSYVPHITLAKIRPKQTKIVGPTFPPSVWSDYQFEDWGDTTFTQLDLCEMKGDSETGYYKVKFSVPLER